jgi:hypothetical protein
VIFTDGTHLMTDGDLDELHRFAQSIGLRRQWFQDHRLHPHYDLTTWRMSNKAVKYGARKVSPKKLVELCSNYCRR